MKEKEREKEKDGRMWKKVSRKVWECSLGIGRKSRWDVEEREEGGASKQGWSNLRLNLQSPP